MGFNQTVWKGSIVCFVCLILATVNVAAWDSSEMDQQMDDMQAEMDDTFSSKFGSSQTSDSDTTDSNDDSDSTTNTWNSGDDTSDSDDDLDREMDDMKDDMDTKFAFFDSSDEDDETPDDSGDSNDDTDSDDTTDDSDARWDYDSNDDSSSDDSSNDNTNDDTNDDTNTEPVSLEDETEQVLHELINDERQQRGLQPFDFDNGLAATADYKSDDMASRGYFAHTSPTGDSFRDIYDQFGYNCRIAHGSSIYLGGENIARTWFNRNVRTDSGSTVHYDDAQSLADGLRRQWMTSSAHRDAILRPYYENHGLGVEITDDGRVYATEHFC